MQTETQTHSVLREPDSAPHTTMRVTKRNGATEPVDVNKIVRAVERCCDGLADVDPMRVATRTISGLYDGATTAELDRLSIQTAAALIAEEPQYSPARRAAARDVHRQGGRATRRSTSFTQSIAARPRRGPDRRRDCAEFVAANARKLDDAIDADARPRFEYFGLRTVYDRYLLRAPDDAALVIETPQYFFLRVACGSAETPAEAIELYRLMSSLDLPAELADAVQLRHARTRRCRRCYLLDSPAGRPGVDLRALHRRRPAVEVRRRHRPRLSPGALARLADPRHQRPLQRHRAVAARRSTPRSPRSTRAAGARARPASTSSRGTPTSRSSSSCATTPATTPAARTTSTSPTGSPTCSCAGSRPTATWSLFDPKRRARAARPVGRGVRRGLRRGRGRRARRAAGQGPRALRAG